MFHPGARLVRELTYRRPVSLKNKEPAPERSAAGATRSVAKIRIPDNFLFKLAKFDEIEYNRSSMAA